MPLRDRFRVVHTCYPTAVRDARTTCDDLQRVTPLPALPCIDTAGTDTPSTDMPSSATPSTDSPGTDTAIPRPPIFDPTETTEQGAMASGATNARTCHGVD